MTFEKAEDGSEIVSIRADGSFVPEVFRLEGENPFGSSLRLVVDVEDAASVADTVSTMDVGARFVKKIRTRFDSRKQKLRTVLDLEPDAPFHVAQTSTSEGRHFAVRLFEGPDPATVEPQDTQEPAEQVS
ncbi:MAG: AMIN domain-containing protein, partial [Desulfobacteraceae bacterium]